MTAHADVRVDMQALAIGYAPVDFLTMDAQRERGAVAIDDPEAFTLFDDFYQGRLPVEPVAPRKHLDDE